jgi:class 3 adenylate cyclase
MPIFLDRHDVTVTAHELAHLHEKDLEVQDRYGVRVMTYWFDEARAAVFCLFDAPDAEAAMRVHQEAHGEVAHQIIPVDLSAVEAFLGRISDPPGVAEQHVHDSAFRAVMFTDIVDSTGLTQRLGDVRALEMVRAHDSIVRRNLKTAGGREIKHLGDGIMASFDSIPASVECARSIQKALDGFRLGSSEPLHVRIGIDAGVPVEESNDLFGATVQAASRLCDAAEPNAILVSETVRRELGDAATVRSLGTMALKGLHKPVAIYRIDW